MLPLASHMAELGKAVLESVNLPLAPPFSSSSYVLLLLLLRQTSVILAGFEHVTLLSWPQVVGNKDIRVRTQLPPAVPWAGTWLYAFLNWPGVHRALGAKSHWFGTFVFSQNSSQN